MRGPSGEAEGAYSNPAVRSHSLLPCSLFVPFRSALFSSPYRTVSFRSGLFPSSYRPVLFHPALIPLFYCSVPFCHALFPSLYRHVPFCSPLFPSVLCRSASFCSVSLCSISSGTVPSHLALFRPSPSLPPLPPEPQHPRHTPGEGNTCARLLECNEGEKISRLHFLLLRKC